MRHGCCMFPRPTCRSEDLDGTCSSSSDPSSYFTDKTSIQISNLKAPRLVHGRARRKAQAVASKLVLFPVYVLEMGGVGR